ncbi:hypothetical protein [Williamsia muralis]|uniref:hypothetical protein n=1 Tax=Williamsia marianensis TaxID=85044 RepID=UPI00117D8F53|nr:hypothetical protein [Williamsia marianensis]
MSVTLDDVDQWDAETLGEVFDRCQRIDNECVRLNDTLNDVGRLEGWGGESAVAASSSLNSVRIDVGELMVQATHIRRAVDIAQTEVQSVKRRLESARLEAAERSLLIAGDGHVSEDISNRPDMTGWTVRQIERYTDEKVLQIRALQAEVDSILQAANDADQDLAAAILGASGQINVAHSNRNQLERDAFHKAFNRDPVSETDWKTAAMLNTATYDPSSRGVPSEVVVARINPVPGQGIVKLGLFIPSRQVFNFPKDDFGDNRGFDSNFGPEDTRATVYLDYENGVVITRQNPSVQVDGQVGVDAPEAYTWQLPDGTVMVDYKATNAFAPPGAELADRVVRGKVILTPGEDGPDLYGNIGDYPSAEAYSERTGEPTRTILRDLADNTGPRGPLLELGSYHVVGERPEQFDQLYEDKAGPGSRAVVPHIRVDGTRSGSASDPPTTVIVD